MPDTRASNPTSSGPSLLDKSTARPADVDMAIFEKNQAQSGSASTGGSQKSQGAVNSNYLEECRRDNPSPADEKTAKRTVTLSDCRIDTPQEDLATDQPFKMSCVATSSDGKPVTSGVTFRLYCTLPDGTEEDTGLAKVGKREGDRICAEGTLYSPKKLVEWGEELKYRVVAEQTRVTKNEDSGKVEVKAHIPPKPIASLIVESDDFFPDSVLILPSAKQKFTELKSLIDAHERVAISITGIGPLNLAGRRAFAVFSFLLGLYRFYETHLLSADGPSEWIEFCALIMNQHIHDSGVSFALNASTTEAYVKDLCSIDIKPQQIINHPNSAPLQCKKCPRKHQTCNPLSQPENECVNRNKMRYEQRSLDHHRKSEVRIDLYHTFESQKHYNPCTFWWNENTAHLSHSQEAV